MYSKQVLLDSTELSIFLNNTKIQILVNNIQALSPHPPKDKFHIHEIRSAATDIRNTKTQSLRKLYGFSKVKIDSRFRISNECEGVGDGHLVDALC